MSAKIGSVVGVLCTMSKKECVWVRKLVDVFSAQDAPTTVILTIVEDLIQKTQRIAKTPAQKTENETLSRIKRDRVVLGEALTKVGFFSLVPACFFHTLWITNSTN
ncbi:MAG: hypothetical protein ABMA02_18640 [Saprospiraceae bacterium]